MASSSPTLRILHVEDNALDACLIGETLRSAWPDCHILQVSTEAALREALAREKCDLVLSDFSLPGFDGLRALGVVAERRPDTPFIFVSGTIGEEIAVDALKRGAVDYVIKDRMSRLIPAIERALTGARERRERQELEEQLHRAQRLESIGLLAGGIAHDLNNMLAPVVMGIDLLRGQTADPAAVRILDMMSMSVERGGSLIKQVLTFARGAKGERHPLELKPVVRDVVGLLRETLPRSIDLRIHADGQPWQIKSDVTELNQLLMNLCVNARDAMPKGGRITITIQNQDVTSGRAARFPGARPGPHVMLMVEDTGTGMPAAVLERIFDPFFTTKPPGKGTGLGLSTVRAIVANHGGLMEVDSVPDQGTTFRLLFPAVVEARAEVSKEALPPMLGGRGETILVADDEFSVRELIRSLLEAYGYRVLTAADGLSALGQFRQRADDIRLVLAGLVMPGMQCDELLGAMRSIRPKIKVLLMSASMDPEDARIAAQNGCEEFLQKPMSRETLLRAVTRALAR